MDSELITRILMTRLIRVTDYQDLLKVVAILLMLLDHLAFYAFPSDLLRVFGRLVMPIFAFFLGYNFHKKNARHELLVVGIMLLVLQLIRTNGNFLYLHILIPMYLATWYISFFNKYSFYTLVLHCTVIASVSFIFDPWMEYGTFPIAIALVGYGYKHKIIGIHAASIMSIGLSAIHSSNFRMTWPYILAYCLILYVLFTIRKFDQKLKSNLTMITKYALPIYF